MGVFGLTDTILMFINTLKEALCSHSGFCLCSTCIEQACDEIDKAAPPLCSTLHDQIFWEVNINTLIGTCLYNTLPVGLYTYLMGQLNYYCATLPMHSYMQTQELQYWMYTSLRLSKQCFCQTQSPLEPLRMQLQPLQPAVPSLLHIVFHAVKQ